MPLLRPIASHSPRRAAGALLLAAACSACGNDGRPGPSSESKITCEGPGFTEMATPEPFLSLEATVVDMDGAPLPDLRAQACGTNLCLNNKTGTDGVVMIQEDTDLTKPAFKYGAGQLYAKFAYPLSGGPDHDIGQHRTARLPEPSTSAPFEPGAEITSGGVTLALAADMNAVSADPFDFDTPELQGFRAVVIPIDKAPPAVDPSLGLELLVALTPVGAELCPAAKLTVDNSIGLDPDTPVEIFLHGVEVDEVWAPYGGWSKVADGRVSSDGATISTNADSGIPILSVVGIRRAP